MIFGKSKDELLKNTQSAVFDIMRVGANISKYRKATGMTQTELADRLGLSFQAVSNWERGQSCPDIANLMALAGMFGVSVDKLLGSERAGKLVEEIHNEKSPEMSIEELKQLAPILKENQANGIAQEYINDGGAVDLIKLADVTPFISPDLTDKAVEKTLESKKLGDIPSNILAYMSEDFINEMAEKIYASEGIEGISHLLPFMSDHAIDEIATKLYEERGINGVPSNVMAYMREERLSEIAVNAFNDGGLEAIPPNVLPFVDERVIGEMVKKVYESNGIGTIPVRILPFADEGILNDIACDILNKQGPEGLSPLLAFIDSSILEDYYRKKWSEQ